MTDYIIQHTDPTIVVSVVVAGVLLMVIKLAAIIVFGIATSENRNMYF